MKSGDAASGFCRRFFECLALGFLAVFIFASPWFYGLVRFKDQLAVESLLYICFLFLIPLIKTKILSSYDLKALDSWINLSCLVGIVYVGISAIFWRSLTAFSLLFSTVVLYCMLRSLVNSAQRFDFLSAVGFLMGAFYSGYGLFQYYGYLPKDFWYQDVFLASRFVNGGHFAAFLLFSVFFGLALFVSVGWLFRVFMLPLLGVQLWALVLSQSRTVWGAFAFGLIFLMVILLKRRIIARGIVSAVFILGIVAIALVAWKFFPLILERLSQVKSIHEVPFYTLVFRVDLWQACLKAMSVRPWGWGIGTFSAIFPMFCINDDRYLIDYAHNEFFQVGVDFGIMGIIFLLTFIVFYTKTALSILSDPLVISRYPHRRAHVAIFLSLFLSLLLTCQFDFPLRIYSNGLLLGLFLALSAHLFCWDTSEDCKHPSIRKLALKTFMFLVVLMFSGFISSHLYAQILNERGRKFEKDFELVKAVSFYEKSVSLMPFSMVYQESLGAAYSKMAILSFDPKRRNLLLQKAISPFERAVHLNSYESSNHYSLARLYEEQRDLQKAEMELGKAISCDPQSGGYVLEYGYFALRHSQVEKAAGLFEKFKSFKFREYPDGDIGYILDKLREKTSRYDLLKKVITDEWRFHYRLGEILAKDGQWEFARLEFEQAIDQARSHLDSKSYHERVRWQIASLYVAAGKPQDAMAIYRTDLKLNSNDSEAEKALRSLSKA
jgi:tetratricopeptide (TPR) repeat protein